MSEQLLSLFSEQTVSWFKDRFLNPTEVQKTAWPAIKEGRHTLVSAPTGTGKTLSAFLVFIDKLKEESRQGTLKEELQVIYVSPLKSLAADIRENLNRPLQEIDSSKEKCPIKSAIRTGDTPQSERRSMINHPPHILIITPESLYLMLTSKSGQGILKTAKTIIIDELHALIDTKRGAHLMLSVARLDVLCGRKLQRIGLSATIRPLETAAEYLAPEEVVIANPNMKKEIYIEIASTLPATGKSRKDPVWEELAAAVYQRCIGSKTVIAFAEARRYAEKLAYYVNLLGGEDFAKVHHGSLSKEQRAMAEEELRSGKLRLLCATSSMELGIDVGDVEQVLQIGCPRTVSGTMQRLGRAGHRPDEVSVMYMYPRTVQEALYSGITAELAKEGGVEHTKPPKMCLDVLAQHLVSMAAIGQYKVEDILPLLSRTYTFKDVTMEDIKRTLSMLAGDYEHAREIPVRPRLLYDRIHGVVEGDNYSRMLAVSAGGTIPDKGLFTVKTEGGVKLGELDEEFIYESYIGDRFLLGSFAWKIIKKDRDSVIVSQAPVEGARPPFWKGEAKGRDLRTGLSFGRIMGFLENAYQKGELEQRLLEMGFHPNTALNVEEFLKRQITATGSLPDEKTVIMEHFTDQNGCHQIMVHALFGKRVNGPLALLIQQGLKETTGINIGCVEDEQGFLLYPYGEEKLPEGLLFLPQPERAVDILKSILPETPAFGITFRYNAARALMMGMRSNKRQPLWMQRLKSTQILDGVIQEKDHPLIKETKRECLEEVWDIEGTLRILEDIRAGLIQVREVFVEVPSPMSLPLQWQVEAAEMYQYAPVTQGMREAAYEELRQMEKLKPSGQALSEVQTPRKVPEDEKRLHSFLMMEGDLLAGELEVPVEWLETLAAQEKVVYMEPGLWIAAEQEEEYLALLGESEKASLKAGVPIIRRMLYYRGAKTEEEIQARYVLPLARVQSILHILKDSGEITKDQGVYYHSKLYERAQKRTIEAIRKQAITYPPERYAALMAWRVRLHAPGIEQLGRTIEAYTGRWFKAVLWEEVIFPARVTDYHEALMERLLSQGDYYWQMNQEKELCFKRTEQIDWEQEETRDMSHWRAEEIKLYQELSKRGASFIQAMNSVLPSMDVREVLFSLAEKGVVCADSFIPVRQMLTKSKLNKATARQRVNVRVKALSAGRWDIVHKEKQGKKEDILETFLKEQMILTKETFQMSVTEGDAFTWYEALSILRIWEYTGQVRRGYFIEGMSGAQFVKNLSYAPIMAALAEPKKDIIWLNAGDPAQVWGKALKHMEGRSFMNIPGTVVALRGGRSIAVLERQGKVLKVWEQEDIVSVFLELVQDFQMKRLFPSIKRLILKEYPKEVEEHLRVAGFKKEMQDFVLYR